MLSLKSGSNSRGSLQVACNDSHREYANWHHNRSGARIPIPVTRYHDRQTADLISTCYFNPVTKTHTAYAIGIDLDVGRAADTWKDASGRIDYQAVLALLRDEHPPLFRYIIYAARSKSGGLHLFFGISPLELGQDATAGAEKAACLLQRRLIELLNTHGLGADPSAVGLRRYFANWRDPEKRLGDDDERSFMQRYIELRRPEVVTILLSYTNSLPQFSYQKKRDNLSLLWPRSTTERRLAELLILLLEGGEQFLSIKDLEERLKISAKTLRSILKAPPGWLLSEYVGLDHTWRLSLNYKEGKLHALTGRAYELCGKTSTGAPAAVVRRLSLSGELCRPSEVQDGERNEWLTKAALKYKHAGVPASSALRRVVLLSLEIPGFETSRNCRSADKIVTSIYRNRPELEGIHRGVDLPEALRARNSQTSGSFLQKPPLGARGLSWMRSRGEVISSQSGRNVRTSMVTVSSSLLSRTCQATGRDSGANADERRRGGSGPGLQDEH